MWDRIGPPILVTPTFRSAHLLTHLLVCPGGQIVYADQSNRLWVLAPDGEGLWHYQVQGQIHTIWSAETYSGEQALFLLLDAQRIVRVVIGKQAVGEFSLRSRVVSHTHLRRRVGDGETLFALEDGGWEWFSWSAFRTVTPDGIPRSFVARHCHALVNPNRQANRIGIGLDSSGVLLATEEHELRHFALPCARELAIDESGRFLYLAFDDHLKVYRNPAFPPLPCKLQLTRVTGELVVGRFQELRFHLRNVGACPIGKILARLDSRGDYVLAAEDVILNEILEPGAEVELTIAVKSSEVGSLHSRLHVTLEDEAGPPAVSYTIECKLDSYDEHWQKPS